MRFTIAGLALALCCACSVFAQGTPSLKDTLQWIHNTLESGAGSLYMSIGNDGEIEKRELTMVTAETCEVTFQYQTGPLEKNSFGVIATPTFQLVQKFNFRDIDPTIITAGKASKDGKPADTLGPYVIFTATARNNIKAIQNRSSGTDYTSDSLTFQLPYPYANRFTKAFKNAVVLCGGKASSF